MFAVTAAPAGGEAAWRESSSGECEWLQPGAHTHYTHTCAHTLICTYTQAHTHYTHTHTCVSGVPAKGGRPPSRPQFPRRPGCDSEILQGSSPDASEHPRPVPPPTRSPLRNFHGGHCSQHPAANRFTSQGSWNIKCGLSTGRKSRSLKRNVCMPPPSCS